MNLASPESILSWLTSMTPDKLAIVLPFMIGYVIVRLRQVNTSWVWLLCPLVAAILFGVLGPVNKDRDDLQNWMFRISVGIVLGFIAALLALAVHSVLFAKLAAKYPILQILVLNDDATETTETKQQTIIKP